MMEMFARKVAEGVDPGLSREGILQLFVSSPERVGEEAWFLAVREGQVLHGLGIHPGRTAQMHVDHSELARLRQGALSLRDPKVTSALRLKGDLAFMQEIVTACSRPDVRTLEDFKLAERHSLSNKDKLVVSHLTRLTSEGFVDMLAQRMPCLISGALDWDALRWTLYDVREKYGHLPFRPGASGAERLSHLVDRVLDGQTVYSCGCAVPDAMNHEFVFPLFKEQDLAPKQLWLGSASVDPVTPLHRDARPVLLAQVLGRKRLLVYPPHQAENLYPRRAHDKYYQPCWVDVGRPDLSHFPKFAKASALEIVLHPGEMLYLPIGWFHCVYALDPVLSVSTIVVRDSEWDQEFNAY